MFHFINHKFGIARLVWQESPRGKKDYRKERASKVWEEEDEAPKGAKPHVPTREGDANFYKALEERKDPREKIREMDDLLKPINPNDAQDKKIIYGELNKIEYKEFGDPIQQRGMTSERKKIFALNMKFLKDAIFYKGVVNNWTRMSVISEFEAQIKNLRWVIKHKYVEKVTPDSNGTISELSGNNPNLRKTKKGTKIIEEVDTEVDVEINDIEGEKIELGKAFDAIRQEKYDAILGKATLEAEQKKIDKSLLDEYETRVIPFYKEYVINYYLVDPAASLVDVKKQFSDDVEKIYEECKKKKTDWGKKIKEVTPEFVGEVFKDVPIDPDNEEQFKRIYTNLKKYEREYYFDLKKNANPKGNAKLMDDLAKARKTSIYYEAVVTNWDEEDLYDEYRKEMIENFLSAHELKVDDFDSGLNATKIRGMQAVASARAADSSKLDGENTYLTKRGFGEVTLKNRGEIEEGLDKIQTKAAKEILKGPSKWYTWSDVDENKKEFVEENSIPHAKKALINEAIVKQLEIGEVEKRFKEHVEIFYKGCID